ncbi:Sterigmatocystin 8-O-methyltransferase [Leucoagaricus sp. SymC.cos]|nr:Sterigmatocystin 8-O-methyltransferase [Leucoagaricus sp. SymC.cos]
MNNHPGSVISSLIAIITTAATSIETYLKSNSEHAYVPSLDNTEPHPLDDAIYPLDIKHAVQCLEGACLQLCATLLRPSHTILNVPNDSQVFQHPCMGIVSRAGVPDIILDKPTGMPVSEISERCGVDPKKLGRVLRLLCSQHIFREVSPGIFANNWLSMQLLSANPMWGVGMHLSDEPINKAAAHLADTILDSEWGHANSPYKSAFNRSTGYPHALWTYFEESSRFEGAMLGWNTTADADAIVTEFPWDKLPEGTVVNDVGGGLGHTAMQLYRKYPNLKLKLQDLPERILQAEAHTWPKECPEAIQKGRITFKVLNLFEEPPIPDCDTYLVRISSTTDLYIDMTVRVPLILNDFLGEHVMQSTTGSEVEGTGAQLVPAPLLPNVEISKRSIHAWPYYLDIAMITLENSAKRTLDEFIKLREAAGLVFVRLWDLVEMSVVKMALVKQE